MGAGLLATPLVAWLAAGATAPAAGAVRWGVLLLGAGLAVSTAHLGRPFRAPLATLGLGRSRLSAEIVVAGIALMLGIVTALLPHASPVLGFTTAAAALALLVTLGLVYALPGQQTWRGAVVWMPLSERPGLLARWRFGRDCGEVRPSRSAQRPRSCWPCDIAAARRCGDCRSCGPRRRSRRDTRRSSHAAISILVSRLALVDILPACCLLAGLPTIAAGLLGLGILVDRIAFYGFASQHTTEAEVGRVEAGHCVLTAVQGRRTRGSRPTPRSPAMHTLEPAASCQLLAFQIPILNSSSSQSSLLTVLPVLVYIVHRAAFQRELQAGSVGPRTGGLRGEEGLRGRPAPPGRRLPLRSRPQPGPAHQSEHRAQGGRDARRRGAARGAPGHRHRRLASARPPRAASAARCFAKRPSASSSKRASCRSTCEEVVDAVKDQWERLDRST